MKKSVRFTTTKTTSSAIVASHNTGAEAVALESAPKATTALPNGTITVAPTGMTPEDIRLLRESFQLVGSSTTDPGIEDSISGMRKREEGVMKLII